MANVADDGSSSLPESASGVASHHEARGVRYVAHNFPDNDDDAESTIRSLLEPDVIVRHCQLSISGLYHFSFADSLVTDLASSSWGKNSKFWGGIPPPNVPE